LDCLLWLSEGEREEPWVISRFEEATWTML
jgi:hypothetical protein